MIAKRAENSFNYARRIIPFHSAREAFGAVLKALDIAPGKVLLPAYIGWSAREGSGVFDPIGSLSLSCSFYALDERLRIDLQSLKTALQSGCIRLLVIIHYFGYVDPSYPEAVRIAREHGVFVVEDAAHALFSDVIAGICGRLGDVCIYSFHKMLPVDSGGAAVINNPRSGLGQKLIARSDCSPCISDYDIKGISARRTANALALNRLILEFAPDIDPLWGPPSGGEVPQTYPVLIRNFSRDRLYHEMNSAGFGVVSLYHTLISDISAECFPQSCRVSHTILNLPVHQDIPEAALESMVRELQRLMRSQ